MTDTFTFTNPLIALSQKWRSTQCDSHNLETRPYPHFQEHQAATASKNIHGHQQGESVHQCQDEVSSPFLHPKILLFVRTENVQNDLLFLEIGRELL